MAPMGGLYIFFYLLSTSFYFLGTRVFFMLGGWKFCFSIYKSNDSHLIRKWVCGFLVCFEVSSYFLVWVGFIIVSLNPNPPPQISNGHP